MRSSRVIRALMAVAGVVAVMGAAPAAEASLPVGFIDTPINAQWQQPVGLTFANNGLMFVWEKAGRVWVVENGVKRATPLIDISEEVGDWRDFGLLGFTLDPAFLTNGRIYLSYVVDYHHLTKFGTPAYDPNANEYFKDTVGRITRYTANVADNFSSIVPGSRAVLVGESITTGVPVLHQSHAMGSLFFGHDGSLLATTGDGGSFQVADDGGPNVGSSNTGLADGIITPDQDVGAFRSQQINSLNGKVLRISPETGDGLADNPYFDLGSPRSARSRVWALGLRNPFRSGIRPHDDAARPAGERHGGVGTVYAGENGWNEWEELNVIKAPGTNCGWPLFEGHDPQPLYQDLNTLNPAAPNPLAGQGGCPATVPFDALCVQDTLAGPVFPNPCNAGQNLPGTLALFEHARPVIDWGHDAGPARLPVFSGNSASTITMGTPGAPVPGNSFGGNSSIGGAWYPTGGVYPAAYHGCYFHADFVAGWIKRFRFDAEDRLLVISEFALNGSFPGIVSLAVNPADSLLYFVQLRFDGSTSVRKIEYVSNLPPVAAASVAGANFGPSPLLIQFSSAGSGDPEGQGLAYEWDFGDGSPISTAANPSHTFVAPTSGPARFDVSLTVRDPGGLEASVPLIVSPNNTPPVIEITSPVDQSLFSPSSTTNVPLTAERVDAEHGPAELSCTWQVRLHHDAHVHPEPLISDCASSAVISGAHGANAEVFYFEFVHTVTDAHGLSASAAVTMSPDVPFCAGDINRDGATNTADLVLLLLDFGSSDAFGRPGDVNYDGVVNTQDLIGLLAGFGCIEP